MQNLANDLPLEAAEQQKRVLLCFNFFALTQNAELLLDVEAYRYFTGLFTIQGDSPRSFPHFFQRLCK